MNKRQKILLAIGLVFIAFLTTYIMVLGISNEIENTDISIVGLVDTESEAKTADVWENKRQSTITPTGNTVSDTSDSVRTVGEIIEKVIPKRHTEEAIAQITIETRRKTRTYVVMKGVEEQTLKKSIGWLPSSAMPGEEGLCVFMGHRDTEFKILKHCEVGDTIIINTSDGVAWNYDVVNIEVIASEVNLRFDSTDIKNLILVTCYPFRYTGHAPQKMVITCKLIY
jgi:sortase A